jgi:hypothetical protein
MKHRIQFLRRRCEFITQLGGAAAMWPIAGRGQQLAMPVIGILSSQTQDTEAARLNALREGLQET